MEEGRSLAPLLDVRADGAIGEFLRSPSEETFVRAYACLSGPLSRYFLVRGVDSFTAEELAQDVLLTLYRRSSEVRNKLCITGWLYRVARNVFLQHVRKRTPSLESLTGKNGEERDLGVAAIEAQVPLESEVFDWVEVLNEDEREICLMRYMDELEYQSIAEALQLPIGTVKWKLHQIKRRLAARLRVANREQNR